MEFGSILQSAHQHHVAGRFAEAERLYHMLLQQRPDHAQVLHGLGILAHQAGDYATAVDYFTKAISAEPSVSAYHNDMAVTLRALDRPREAVEYYRRAVDIGPETAQLHNNLGNALAATDNLVEAESEYRMALDLEPAFIDARINLAFLLQQQGRLDQAESMFRAVCSLDKSSGRAQFGWANVLREQGHLEDAVVHYELALARDHDTMSTRNNLGLTLTDLDRADEAIHHYEFAVTRIANSLATPPTGEFANLHLNLGNALMARCRVDEALESFDRARAVQPQNLDALWNRSFALLLKGEFQSGWPAFEVRRHRPQSAPREYSVPEWNGQELSSKTILVHAEQGYGDTIQFLRFAAVLARRGGNVIIACQQPLVRLAAGAKGVQRAVAFGKEPSDIDFQAPIMSLPLLLLRTRPETFADPMPYLTAGPPSIPIPGEEGRIKVGIVWAGNPKHPRDRKRSCPVELFLSLADIPGVSLYSLQLGPQGGDLRQPETGTTVNDLAGSICDFADTAGIVARLDLVITVDTAVAHLAGGLGHPTWVLIPFSPDWRWLLNSEDTPWYPSMRLFRQKMIGDWPEVFARVSDALRLFVERRR